MENVILIVLLLLAAALIAVVLLQRSEGGGLGMGGGGGAGGGVQARGAGNALTQLTWILGTAFMVAALAMTVLSARNAATSSVVDTLPAAEESDATLPDLGESLLPPTGDAEPLLPVAE